MNTRELVERIRSMNIREDEYELPGDRAIALLNRERPEIRPSESARDTANQFLCAMVITISKPYQLGKVTVSKNLINDLAALIEADRKREREEAAKWAIPALCNICEREWGMCPDRDESCDWKTELRAAILGEAKP